MDDKKTGNKFKGVDLDYHATDIFSHLKIKSLKV